MSAKSPTAETVPPAPVPRLITSVDGWVKGGTRTAAHDAQVQALEADAEKRRDQLDRDRAIAATPIEQGGGVMYTNKFLGNPDVAEAKVVLDYLARDGSVAYQCLADIVYVAPDELALIIVCPRHIEQGMPQGQAQIQIRQKNRAWYLDETKRGDIVVFEGRPVISAGEVCDSERFTCDCGWSARIHKNRVYTQ